VLPFWDREGTSAKEECDSHMVGLMTVTGRDGGQSQSIATVERALDVLLLFADKSHSDLGVTEIAERLNMPKAAVHRILTSLRNRDMVWLDLTTRRYSLGVGALGLALGYFDRLDVRKLIMPELRRLSDETGETSTMSIRLGDARTYVAQELPNREIRMEVKLGVAYPLHAGGSSKALLAFMPREEQDAYLARGDLEQTTPASLTDVEALRRELSEIRSRGYATSTGERQAGASSVAAPVLDHQGQVAAVVSVSGPAQRFDSKKCADALLQLTGELSWRMGYRPN
jgi:IclR family transcriptional regulator, acetate operon repressor